MRFIWKTLLGAVWVFCFSIICLNNSQAQTLGGQAAYNFLRLPPTPLLAAAGGLNISYNGGEVGSTTGNPALLQPTVSRQINSSFNALLAGTKAYSLTGALHNEKLATTFGGHIQYLDYGQLTTTDAAGNASGGFRPVDYVVQLSAARQYLQRWHYGLTLKYIQSAYGPYRSSALAADVGLHYHDSSRFFSAAVVVRNMGGQLQTYTGETEELPFDLQVGITKRLSKAPFGFSLTAQHLQTFDILYNDTTFNRDNNSSPPNSAINQLLTHLVIATHMYAGPYLEATVGYNFLQRRELTIDASANGLTGFSAGLRLRFSKLQVLYARSAYQRGVAANLIGITVHLDKLFGVGH